MGGIILVGSVVIWCLSAFPSNVNYSKDYVGEAARISAAYDNEIRQAEETNRSYLVKQKDRSLAELKRARQAEKMEHSYMGKIGKAIGIDWRGGVSLVSGFVAKEIVVSTLGVLYAVDDGEQSDALRKALKASGMTPLSALCMMIFVLLYLPCLATVTAIRRETGSVKWMLFSIFYSTSLAWLASFGVYQAGRLIGYS